MIESYHEISSFEVVDISRLSIEYIEVMLGITVQIPNPKKMTMTQGREHRQEHKRGDERNCSVTSHDKNLSCFGLFTFLSALKMS